MITARTRSLLRLIPLGILLVVAAALAISGINYLAVCFAAALPWLVAARARLGAELAVAAVGLTALLVPMLGMLVTAAFGLPMLATLTVVELLLGALGLVQVHRQVDVQARPGAAGLAVWIPAGLGAAIWVGALVFASTLSTAANKAWVLLGDSANNLIFAREVLYRGGLDLGPASNPVPLPSTVLAIVFAGGRGSAPATALTEHDITAFVGSWAIALSLMCIVVGASVGVVVRAVGARASVVGVASAGASLLPLSWFFSGYPLEYGFFNTQLAIPIVVLALIAGFAAQRAPVAALCIEAVAGSLLLAVWSPLVLIPAMVAVVIAVLHWREVLASRGVRLAALIASYLQLVLWVALKVIPNLIEQSGFLSAAGGAFGFRRWMLAALAAVACGLALFAFRRLRHPIVLTVAVTAAASLLGLAAILFITRDSENPWSYYPLKLLWLMSVILVVLVVAGAAAVVARFARRRSVAFLGLAVVAAGTAGFLAWTPPAEIGYDARAAIDRIVNGDVLGDGDVVAEQIFEYANSERSTILWQSDNAFEGVINFWVMQLWSDSMSENLDLKYAAYGDYDVSNPDDLCRVVGLMGGAVTVITANPQLQSEVGDACPAVLDTSSIELVR